MTRYYQVSDYQLITKEHRYRNSSESLKSCFLEQNMKSDKKRTRKKFKNIRIFWEVSLIFRYYQFSDYQLITVEYRYRNSSESLKSCFLEQNMKSDKKRTRKKFKNIRIFREISLISCYYQVSDYQLTTQEYRCRDSCANSRSCFSEWDAKLAKNREKIRKGLGNARVFKINPLMTLYYQVNNYQLITEEYRYRNSSKSWRNTGGSFPGKRTAVNPQLNLSELVNCHVTFYRRLVMFWNRVPCRNDQVPCTRAKIKCTNTWWKSERNYSRSCRADFFALNARSSRYKPRIRGNANTVTWQIKFAGVIASWVPNTASSNSQASCSFYFQRVPYPKPYIFVPFFNILKILSVFNISAIGTRVFVPFSRISSRQRLIHDQRILSTFVRFCSAA